MDDAIGSDSVGIVASQRHNYLGVVVASKKCRITAVTLVVISSNLALRLQPFVSENIIGLYIFFISNFRLVNYIAFNSLVYLKCSNQSAFTNFYLRVYFQSVFNFPRDVGVVFRKCSKSISEF